MIDQARADEDQRIRDVRSGTAAPSDEGYWAYMQRQIQERTENLGFASDGMDNLEQNSKSWVDDVNKFVGQQKRSAATSCKSLGLF